MKKVLNALAVAAICTVPLSAFAAEPRTAEECIASALPQFSFSIMTEDAELALHQLMEHDKEINGRYLISSEVYFGLVDDLPSIPTDQLELGTYEMTNYFRFVHVHDETEPMVRAFVKEAALKDEDGKIVGNPVEPHVFLPKRGRAYAAAEVADILVTDVCNGRAKVSGLQQA